MWEWNISDIKEWVTIWQLLREAALEGSQSESILEKNW